VSQTFGLGPNSNWVQLVKAPPAHALLEYVHTKWLEYVAKYSGVGESFQSRDEPALTKGLAAFLADESEIGKQTFAGEFFGELAYFDLEPDGTTRCTRRTDIEWRLYSVPCFIVEFKILDGSAARRNRYLQDGIARFVQGQYSAGAGEAAMCGFLRSAGAGDPAKIEALISTQSASLKCHPLSGPPVVRPSQLVPKLASFDTAHQREAPAISPVILAHVFISLPA
jgi:hypothetical protein